MLLSFLDSHTLNPGDLDLSALTTLGKCDIYPQTPPDLIIERCIDSEIIITNKCQITAEVITALPKLKYIQVAATGYNNIDLAAAKERNISVSNVSGYSTSSVVQHTFALLLGYLNQTQTYARETHRGDWSAQPHFSYWHSPINELNGLTLGIIGMGTIGKQVAEVGRAFGMKIISPSRGPEKDTLIDVDYLDWDSFYQSVDVVSLHCPLTPETANLINKESLEKMKSSTILINTSRGGTVDEKALREALKTDQIKVALLDVLSQEPPPADHILLGIDNCLITPHQAWGSLQSRQRLLDGIVSNIKAYLEGEPQNVVF